MKKTVSLILSSAISLSLLSACGSEGSLLSSADAQLQALSFAADAGEFTTNGQFGPGGREGAPGQRPGKMGKQGQGMHGNFLFAGIELTDAQKTEFEALETEKRSQMEALKTDATAPDESAREAAQTAIESAFLSDSFDADALQASLEANKPDHSAKATLEAEYLIKSWNILTSEQQSAVISNVAERAAEQAERLANMELKDRPERPEALTNPLVEKLGLSEDQQAALEAAREANKPESEPQDKNPEALVNALAEGATAAEIVALQSANRPDKNPLQHLATLHAILTVDQRQTFVDSGLLQANGGKGGPGHHGQMGGPGGGQGKQMGGPGGHGGKMGGPGGPGFGNAPGFAQSPDLNSGY